MSLSNQFLEAKKFKDFYVFAKTVEASAQNGERLTKRKISKMIRLSPEYMNLTKPEKAKYFNSLVFLSLGKFTL